jgi:dihydrofolate reductase
MALLRVHNLAISIDGYAAGPDQGIDHPLGLGGPRLHEWVFATRRGRAMLGLEDGDEGGEGLDNDYIARGEEGIGATIMGRNMFGPVRGAWEDHDEWTGWWGPEPPYHHPVFVLTHHAREPLEMDGGTTFHFVTGGIHAALEQAVEAADGDDVRLGGGVATIQQYLRAGLIDEMHLAIVPVLLGAGERLFEHLSGGPVGYECVELVTAGTVAHVRIARGRPTPVT